MGRGIDTERGQASAIPTINGEIHDQCCDFGSEIETHSAGDDWPFVAKECVAITHVAVGFRGEDYESVVEEYY